MPGKRMNQVVPEIPTPFSTPTIYSAPAFLSGEVGLIIDLALVPERRAVDRPGPHSGKDHDLLTGCVESHDEDLCTPMDTLSGFHPFSNRAPGTGYVALQPLHPWK